MADGTGAREQHFLEQKEIYRQILDAIADMVLVKGAQSRILWANTAFREYYGMTNEQLYELIDAPFNEPDYTAQYVRDDAEVYTTGKVLAIPEEPVTRHDGTVRTFHTVKSPLRDPSGRVIMTVGVSRDITEQKHVEKDLARYRERLEALVAERTQELTEVNASLQTILTSLAEGIVAVDAVGGVRLANPAALALLGWSEGQVVGHPFLSLLTFVPEGAGGETSSALEGAPRGGAVRSLEELEELGEAVTKQLVRPDGERRFVNLRAAPLRDGSGRRSGSVIVLRDVTAECAAAEQQLRHQKLESLGLLAGGIAHDFNNILSGILGSISVARLDLARGVGVEELLAQAERACGRARELTGQLVTFARGGAPLKRPTSLPQPVREAAQLALRGSACALSFECAPGLSHVDGDAGQLAQVINNLVLNARQAMADGGHVTIQLRDVVLTSGRALPLPPGRYVEIAIRDGGCGIAPENLPRIFDPYFTTRATGSGLGLASVHSIVRQHGGHVTVVSAVGEGTTFTLYLPAIDVAEAPQVVPPLSSRRTRGRRVLLVDDDDVVRAVAGLVLGRLGHRVTPVADGAAALEAFAEAERSGDPYQAAFVDLTMPGGMPGKAVIEWLRGKDPTIWLVVMSGYSHDPIMANHRDWGIDACLPKPFTVAQVAACFEGGDRRR